MLHGVVYCITNQLNGKQYVGSTVQKIDCNQASLTIAKQRNSDRFSTNEQSPIANAQREFGKENFTIEILEDLGLMPDDQRKELQAEGFKLEKLWITKLGTFHSGYNCSEDGQWTMPRKGCYCLEIKRSFQTCSEAAEFFGRNVSMIFDVLSGKLKHIKGRDGKLYHLTRKVAYEINGKTWGVNYADIL